MSKKLKFKTQLTLTQENPKPKVFRKQPSYDKNLEIKENLNISLEKQRELILKLIFELNQKEKEITSLISQKIEQDIIYQRKVKAINEFLKLIKSKDQEKMTTKVDSSENIKNEKKLLIKKYKQKSSNNFLTINFNSYDNKSRNENFKTFNLSKRDKHFPKIKMSKTHLESSLLPQARFSQVPWRIFSRTGSEPSHSRHCS